MDGSSLVEDIEFEFPSRATQGFSAPNRKKPRARVRFVLEGGRERDAWVPARVARLFNKNLPEEPCTLERALGELSALEERQCFVALTEMLSRRDHSVHEAHDKLLCAGFKPASVDRAVERAEDLRFLNDARFTESFIEERIRRGWGRRKVELELARRGVDPARVEGWPERFFNRDDDLERACALLAKKSVPATNPYQKLVRHLMSKGFPYDVASDAVKRRLAEDD